MRPINAQMKSQMNQENARDYKPGNALESKAIFLETTLEKMQSFSDSLYKKIKRTKKSNPDDPALVELEEKLKSVNKGLQEVFTKCNIIWNDIKNPKQTTNGDPR